TPFPTGGEGERGPVGSSVRRRRSEPAAALWSGGRRPVMRALTARFALGVTLLAVVCAMADSARAGPLRNRRAAAYSTASYGGCCGDGGYGSVGAAYSPGTVVGYGQSMYYPSAPYVASGCCPQTTYGSSMYYPGTAVGYGSSMYYPGSYAYG